jgi:putative peptidoglycan lipid II flippase
VGEAERREITGRAAIVALGTLTSRALGLVREQVLAAMFSRAATDAFFVAFTIPNVLRQLLAEGAVQTAVLPVLAEIRERRGELEARRFLPRDARAVPRRAPARHRARDPGRAVARRAVRRRLPRAGRPVRGDRHAHALGLPYIFFMGTAALGVAALNTYRRFVVTSFAPGLLNLGFIACALLLPGWLGARGHERTLALAAGVLLGGALQVVAQWPSLRAIGYLERPTLDLLHPGVRAVLSRMAPVLVGLGVYYVDVILARRFLSELGLGAQSYFAFALRLCDFPRGSS